ncbi:MAG: cob(I)yrinic acid a,c-diamide adenosyltransferase [Candidatus Aminicenantales bacterium]
MKKDKALKNIVLDEGKRAKRGYIQIYTGKGKGKTTAALGLALRAAGYGMRVYIGQFLKGQTYGELQAAKKLAPFIKIEQYGRKGFIHVTKNPDEEDMRRAKKGLRRCLAAMLSGQYRIIILDEINVAVYFNILSEKEVHEFLDQKPPEVEVVLTGRYAPSSFIRRADLVTEMKEKKHYFAKGVRARDGIER